MPYGCCYEQGHFPLEVDVLLLVISNTLLCCFAGANNVGLLMGRIKMTNAELQAKITAGDPQVVQDEDTLRILQQVLYLER